MDKALWRSEATQKRAGSKLDWRKKMSDNVAYALLIYTGLQIWVTMGTLKTGNGSILPYFALIVTFAQKYQKDAGVGTVVALMLPYVIIVFVAWTVLLALWQILGLPWGF